ncbi:MAG: DHCW motif cupin fold protein, partial [Candidatus Zixiibacteriota bacterium]
MNITNLPFEITDWLKIEPTEHTGETGKALWRTRQFGDIRVRLVEYTPGYLADHWCLKGQILFCVKGELHTELEDGRKFFLKPG